jgi:hypothetical protein
MARPTSACSLGGRGRIMTGSAPETETLNES